MEYGYLSIFLLVFLQEIGIPSFPNELLLLYTGYLAYKGILDLFKVLMMVVAADISGSFILYILFFLLQCVPDETQTQLAGSSLQNDPIAENKNEK